MCPVIGIVYSVSCRMGEKNIESFLSPEWKPHFKNTVSHLSFRILVDSRTVTIGTTKSHNTDAFIFIDFIFYADAPLGRSFLVTVIVIAVYIEYRTFTKGCQKGKIFRI